MAKQVQIRRGPLSNLITLVEGELGFITDTKELVVGASGGNQFMAKKEHQHAKADITDFAHQHAKADITDFAHQHAKADITDFAHTHPKSEITDFAHSHSKSEITDFAHTHEANDITDFTAEVLAISPPWKLIRENAIGISTAIAADNVTVVSGNYYGKILAFEVRVNTGDDAYETHIVFARMGTDNTTSTSETFDRFYSWTTFDGRYFKTHSFKAYCSNATSTTITVGAMKHLVGSFLNNTIEWTTPQITTYLERIWLVN